MKRKWKTTVEPPPWTPFVEAALPEGEIGDMIRKDPTYVGTFINSRYQVQITQSENGMMWLAIVNKDRSARHDWRDFQRIKNELCGEEREALEIYPAESRLVDTNNQFHLFVLPAGESIPLGYAERDVGDLHMDGAAHKQRPFEVKPKDLNTLPRDAKDPGFAPARDLKK